MGYRSKVRKDLTGQKFHLLTVLKQADNVGVSASDRYGQSAWYCSCDCGGSSVVAGSSLSRGVTTSCGCVHRTQLAERNRRDAEQHTIHGMHKHRLYDTWIGINQRCLNPECKSFGFYGVRGIGVHPEWRNDDKGCAPAYHDGDRSGVVRFIEWIESNLGPKPEGYSLDRIDNSKDYEPGNLKWSSAKEQANNRRRPKRKVEQRFLFGY